jgi:hypothetical protein
VGLTLSYRKEEISQIKEEIWTDWKKKLRKTVQGNVVIE